MINQERLIQTFLDLVQIDSPSTYEKEVAAFAAHKLEKLGANVAFDSFGNIIASIEGSGEPFMVNSHLDTVEPGRGIKPKVEGNKIISDGSTILGADAKAGVAIILESLASLAEDKKANVPLEIVLTLQEEIGLIGSKNLDFSMIQSKRGITFDGEEFASQVMIGGPGYNQIAITVHGKSAHAGTPEKGVSAISIAAELLTKLHVGRIDAATTANIGLISGGSAVNTVPEEVTLLGEIRSRELSKLEEHTEGFRQAVAAVQASHQDATIDLQVKREFDPYMLEKTNPTIVLIEKVLRQLHLEPQYYVTGGGTDVNIFQKHGIQAVCVGIGGVDMHTKREYVNIPAMTQATEFFEKLILQA